MLQVLDEESHEGGFAGAGVAFKYKESLMGVFNEGFQLIEDVLLIVGEGDVVLSGGIQGV